MSTSSFIQGQRVTVTQNHNQFTADSTVYNVAKVDRITGQTMVMLSLDGKVLGALPETKVRAI